MDLTTKKTLTVSRGFTYTYFTAPPKDNKPTLLLTHGFPDDASEWSGLISHLVPAGYGVIAPDLLGYSGTSKPTDPAAFAWRPMIKDLTELLDAESTSTAILLGHDWGSATAQAFYNLAPARAAGLVMVNVPFQPASAAPFDLDAVLAATEKVYGFGLFWYWKLFTAPDGPDVMNAHADRAFDLLHSTSDVWRATVCADGGTRAIVTGHDPIPRQAYATEEMKRVFVERMRRDGFEAPLCWYRAQVEHYRDGELDVENRVVNVPTLFIGYRDDVVCRADGIGEAEKQGLLPHLTTVVFDGTHWALLAKPDEFGTTVVSWLDQTYAGSKV